MVNQTPDEGSLLFSRHHPHMLSLHADKAY
jgi:hypothetical protein